MHHVERKNSQERDTQHRRHLPESRKGVAPGRYGPPDE
jgi:hypothetical protein